MGKLRKISLILFLLFFIFSCSNENDDSDSINEGDNDFVTDIDVSDDSETDESQINDSEIDESESDEDLDEEEIIEEDVDETVDKDLIADEDTDNNDQIDPTYLEDWEMYLTVDNMFDVYFGTPSKTTGEVVGRGDNWTKEYFFKAEGRLKTDYMYVATASDHSTAQGFIGTFKNLTRQKITNTGDKVWQVFPAGAHEETNPFWPDPWPARLMPTQEEVDKAIAFAEENDLWVDPVGPDGYDNDPSTAITPGTKEWGTQAYENIPKEAMWIWHESGKCASAGWVTPLSQCNHDEFLVFRVPGLIQM